MKFSMFITENKLQLNLTPETDHEKEAMKALEGYTGPAAIHKGVSIGPCHGGYVRNFGEEANTTAITIDKASSFPPL